MGRRTGASGPATQASDCCGVILPWGFYRLAGWQPVAGARTLVGPDTAPALSREVMMMLPVVPKSEEARRAFVKEPLYLGIDACWRCSPRATMSAAPEDPPADLAGMAKRSGNRTAGMRVRRPTET
jgi:hypothetical protein